jgi:acyl carrier protein
MLPNIYIKMDTMPTKASGKIDYMSLPDPEFNTSTDSSLPRNEIESTIHNLYSKILKLPVNSIGVKDNFFRLGGNSITAVQLMHQLNDKFGTSVKVAEIFAYTTIESLANYIAQTKTIYQTLIRLNTHNPIQPLLFMLHPAGAGCEVYISIAQKLTPYFNCYGVDSYNLYNQLKIRDLDKLAEYYLQHIQEKMQQAGQQTYYLLGWSLGGLTALEIARTLERTGYKNIIVILLDTLILEQVPARLEDEQHLALKEVRDLLQKQQYEQVYIDKVMDNLTIEHALKLNINSQLLYYTKILLFKALKCNEALESDKTLFTYTSTLAMNNLEKVVTSLSQINKIELENFHHGNILQAEDLLVSAISKFI